MFVYILLLFVFGVSSVLLNFTPVGNQGNLQVVVTSQLNYSLKRKIEKTICIFSAIILIIIATCRANSVGYDTINYEAYYDFKKMYPNNMTFEPLFECINWLSVVLKLPFSFVLLICSAIIISSLSVAIYKYSPNVSFSWFLFVALGLFGNTFNAVRQYLAAAVFIFSIRYILDGKLLHYILCCVVAFYFHSSAIILFPLYFIRYIKLNNISLFVSLIVTVFVGLFMEQIIKVVSLVTNFNYYERYYVTNVLWEPIKLYYILYSLGMIAVFLMFYLYRKRCKNLTTEQQKIFDIFLTLFYISVCIRVIGTFSNIFSLVNRFSIYFFFSIIFIIPYIISELRGELNIFILSSTLILGLIYNLISAMVRKTNGIYPYKFVWNNSFYSAICIAIILLLCIVVLVQSFKFYTYKGVRKIESENINNTSYINSERFKNNKIYK